MILKTTVHKKILDQFLRLRALSVPVFVLTFSLTVWAAARLMLILLNVTRIEFSGEMLQMIPFSIRFDLLIFSYIWGAFIILYLLTPFIYLPTLDRYVWRPTFTFLCGLIVYLEMVTIPFMSEYGNRLDRISVEYLKYPNEVLSMVAKHYKTEVLLSIIMTAVVVRLFWNSYGYVAARYVETDKGKSSPVKAVLSRAVILLCVLTAVVIGGRSSFGHRPANISSASFSSQHLVNELTLNSTYTVLYDMYRMKHESNPFDVYPSMPEEQIYSLVKAFSETDGKVFREGSKTIVNTAATVHT
ncbi:MAG TPA: hypothetical protein EYN96_10015, partial [Candidatus Hydrogenedentes bacterium]|nr:hypothetical protein [Candidatus Hydrogenedentota bacterium]